jgi:hypothetical protein
VKCKKVNPLECSETKKEERRICLQEIVEHTRRLQSVLMGESSKNVEIYLFRTGCKRAWEEETQIPLEVTMEY